MHEMVIASFLVKNKKKKICCFYNTFMVADIYIELIIAMPFLILNNVDIVFAERTYLNKFSPKGITPPPRFY